MAGTGNNHLLYQQPFQPTDNLYYRLQEGLQRARYGDFMAALVLHTTVILEQASLLRELMRDSRALYNKIVENAQVVKNLEAKTNNIERHVSVIEQKLNLHDLVPCAPPPHAQPPCAPPPHAQPPCGIYTGYERTFNEQPVHAMCGQDQQPPLVSLARMTQNQRLVEEHFQRSGIPRPPMPPRPPHPHTSSSFSANFSNAPMYNVQRPVNPQPPFQMLPNNGNVSESVVSHQQSNKSPVSEVFPHLVLPEGITIIPINPEKNQDKTQNEHRSPHDQSMQLMQSAPVPSLPPQFQPPPPSIIIHPTNEHSVKSQEPPIISITPARVPVPAEQLQKRRRKPLSSNINSSEIIHHMPDHHLESNNIHTYVHSDNIQRHKPASQVSITTSHRNPIVSLPSRIHFEASAQTNNVTVSLEEYNTHQVTRKQSYNKSMNLDRLLQKITEMSHNKPANDANVNNERNLTEIVPVECVGSRRRKNICKTSREKVRYYEHLSDNPVDLTTNMLHVNENMPVSIDGLDKSTDIDSTMPIIVSVSGAVNIDSIIHNNEDDQDMEEEDIYHHIPHSNCIDDENPEQSIFTPEVVLTEVNSEDEISESPLNLQIDQNWNKFRKLPKSSSNISLKTPSRSCNETLSQSSVTITRLVQDENLSSFTSNSSSFNEEEKDVDIHQNNHGNDDSHSNKICCSFKSRLVSEFQTDENDFEDLEIVVQEIISELVLCVENRFMSLENGFSNMLYTDNMYECKGNSEENSENEELHGDVNDSQGRITDEIALDRLESASYSRSDIPELDESLNRNSVNISSPSTPTVINVDSIEDMLLLRSKTLCTKNSSEVISESGSNSEANKSNGEISQASSTLTSLKCNSKTNYAKHQEVLSESAEEHSEKTGVTFIKDKNDSHTTNDKLSHDSCQDQIPQTDKNVKEYDACHGHKDVEKDMQPMNDNLEVNANICSDNSLQTTKNSELHHGKELSSVRSESLDKNELLKNEKTVNKPSSDATVETNTNSEADVISESQVKERLNLDHNSKNVNLRVDNVASCRKTSDANVNEIQAEESFRNSENSSEKSLDSEDARERHICSKKAGGILSDKRSKKEHRKVKFADEILKENIEKNSSSKLNKSEKQSSKVAEDKAVQDGTEYDLQSLSKNKSCKGNSVLSNVNDSIFSKLQKKSKVSSKQNESSPNAVQPNKSINRNVFSIMEEIYNGCFSKTLDTDNEVDNPQPCSSKTVSRINLEVNNEPIFARSADDRRGDILHQIINKQIPNSSKTDENEAQRTHDSDKDKLIKDTPKTIQNASESLPTERNSPSVEYIEKPKTSSERKEVCSNVDDKIDSSDEIKELLQKKENPCLSTPKKTEAADKSEAGKSVEKSSERKSKSKSPSKGNSPIIKIKPVKQMMVGQRTDTSIQIIIQQKPESVKRKDTGKHNQKDSQRKDVGKHSQKDSQIKDIGKHSQKDSQIKDKSFDNSFSGKQHKVAKQKKSLPLSSHHKLDSNKQSEGSLNNNKNGDKLTVNKIDNKRNKQAIIGKIDSSKHVSSKPKDSDLLVSKSNEQKTVEHRESRLTQITADENEVCESKNNEKESNKELLNIPSKQAPELVKPMTIKLTREISKQLTVEQKSDGLKRKKSGSFERSTKVPVESANERQADKEVLDKDTVVENTDKQTDPEIPDQDHVGEKINDPQTEDDILVKDNLSEKVDDKQSENETLTQDIIPSQSENKQLEESENVNESSGKHPSVNQVNNVMEKILTETNQPVVETPQEFPKDTTPSNVTVDVNILEINEKSDKDSRVQNEASSNEVLQNSEGAITSYSSSIPEASKNTKTAELITSQQIEDLNLENASTNQDSLSTCVEQPNIINHISTNNEKEENTDFSEAIQDIDSLKITETLINDANEDQKKELSGKVKVTVKKKSRIDPFYRKRRRRSKPKISPETSSTTENSEKKENVTNKQETVTNKQSVKKKISLNVKPVRQSHRIKTRILEKKGTSKLGGTKKGEELIKRGKKKSVSQKNEISKNAKEIIETFVPSILTKKTKKLVITTPEITEDLTATKEPLKGKKNKEKIPNSDSIPIVSSKSSTPPAVETLQSSCEDINKKSKPSRKISSSAIKTKSKKQKGLAKNENNTSDQNDQSSVSSTSPVVVSSTKTNNSKTKVQSSKSSPRVLHADGSHLPESESSKKNTLNNSQEMGESSSKNAKLTRDSLLVNDTQNAHNLIDDGSVRKESVSKEIQSLVPEKGKKRKKMAASIQESKATKKSKNQLKSDNQTVIPSTATVDSEESQSQGNEPEPGKKLKVSHAADDTSKGKHELKASGDISELSQTTDKICINEIIRLLDRNIEAGAQNNSENGGDMENAETLTRAIRIWEEHDYSRFPIEVLRSSEDESTDNEMSDGKSEKEVNSKTTSDEALVKPSSKSADSSLKSSGESTNQQVVESSKGSCSSDSETCSNLAVQARKDSSESIAEKNNSSVSSATTELEKGSNDKKEINSQTKNPPRTSVKSKETNSSVSKSVKDSSLPGHSESTVSNTVSESPTSLVNCVSVGERSGSSGVSEKQDGADEALKFKQIIRSKFQNKLKMESPIGDNYMTVLKAVLQKRNILGEVNSLIPEQCVNFQALKHRLSSAMSVANLKPAQNSTPDESPLQPQVQCVNIFTIHEIWKYLKCFINDPSRGSLVLRHLGQKEIQQFLVLGKLCLLQAQQDETDLIFKKTTNTQDLTVEMLEKAIQLLEEGATE